MRTRMPLRYCAVFCLGIFLVLVSTSVQAKELPRALTDIRYHDLASPIVDLPADLQKSSRPSLAAAAADTFVLGSWSFNGGDGSPDAQGWVSVDLTEQLGTFFHVGTAGSELDGGQLGNLLALEGNNSMWCGIDANTGDPFCGWATLPGYGTGWTQDLNCQIAGCDSFKITYKVFWDAEPGFDGTVVQYSDDGGANYTSLPVNGGSGIYDGVGPTGGIVEMFDVGGLSGAGISLRFRFTSDGGFDDEDGFYPSDGGVLIDSITVEWWNAGVPASPVFSDFESATEGDLGDAHWSAGTPAGFGDFAALYPGVTVPQQDPCFFEFSPLWGFFDDPVNTEYNCGPTPLPGQGAVPFGPINGLYMSSEIWSPFVPNIGGGTSYTLTFSTYRELPLDNLVFFVWRARSMVGGCPTPWGSDFLVNFGGTDWLLAFPFNVGPFIDPNASDQQIAIGVIDACGFWCNVFGTGVCHSHSPLFDNVEFIRVDTQGPQYIVRHFDLFQDNFPEDGTITGIARADVANDVSGQGDGVIDPGDSAVVTITNLGTDPFTGTGPTAYVFARVQNGAAPDPTGAAMQSGDLRAGNLRYPHVETILDAGITWHRFRMDSATVVGVIIADRYAIDLNDGLFVAGDTIHYIFCSDDGLGNSSYWTRRSNGQGAANAGGELTTANRSEALATPMEFTILPAGGVANGGNILYVDDADDRNGPVQLFFDTAFQSMGVLDEVDRFDVIGPSSNVSNSLAGRVKNTATQIIGVYDRIIWSSANLTAGLIGDGLGNGGTGAEESPDFSLLFQFLDTHTDNPGLYVTGDNIPSDWLAAGHPDAISLRQSYMDFAVANDDHVQAGEPISPVIDGVGACFAGEQFVAYGGCGLINDFDVLSSNGSPDVALTNVSSGAVYALSQATANNAATTARVILEGFSYHYIRDLGPATVPARFTHLQNAINWFGDALPVPVGIDKNQFVNRLAANYPNPFNPTTTIAYSIKDQGQVTLKVFNAAGQLVRTLVNEIQAPVQAGFSVTWDGKSNTGQSVASGVYFYRLTASNFVETQKMVLLK